jgi:hypothetical protein
MNKLLPIDLYEKSEKRNNGDINSLNKKPKKSPAVYIDSNANISIEGNKITIISTQYDLSSYTVLDIVNILTGNGINASISNERYAMYPAILLVDFASKNTKISNIKSSPQNLLEYGAKYMEAVHDINDSLSFNVVEISTNGKQNLFELIDTTVYSDIDSNAVIIYEEIYTKYFLNVQSFKVINGYMFDNNSIIGRYVTSGS